jgi:hypothetical protein
VTAVRREQSFLFVWRSAIAASSLSSTCKLVALTLSLHMNGEGGSCFPSYELLAAEASLSDVTVRRAVSALVDAQLLELKLDRRGPGRGTRCSFRALTTNTVSTSGLSTSGATTSAQDHDHSTSDARTTHTHKSREEEVTEDVHESDENPPPRERSRAREIVDPLAAIRDLNSARSRRNGAGAP